MSKKHVNLHTITIVLVISKTKIVPHSFWTSSSKYTNKMYNFYSIVDAKLLITLLP